MNRKHLNIAAVVVVAIIVFISAFLVTRQPYSEPLTILLAVIVGVSGLSIHAACLERLYGKSWKHVVVHSYTIIGTAMIAGLAKLAYGVTFATWFPVLYLVAIGVLMLWGLWYYHTGGFNSVGPPNARSVADDAQ